MLSTSCPFAFPLGLFVGPVFGAALGAVGCASSANATGARVMAIRTMAIFRIFFSLISRWLSPTAGIICPIRATLGPHSDGMLTQAMLVGSRPRLCENAELIRRFLILIKLTQE